MLKEVSGDAKERRIMKMLGKGYINPEEAPDLLKDLLEDLEADIKLKAESV
jgi:HEAT repeat protein